MELFEWRDGRAYPTLDAIRLEPFKTIWESDPDPEHVEAIKIFTYIDLLCVPRKSNPFYYGFTEDSRPKAVKKEIWGDNPPDIDAAFIIIAAVKRFRELQEQASPTLALLDSAMKAVDELKAYLDNVDFKERTASGSAVTKPRDVIVALNGLPGIVKNVLELKAKVHEELAEEAKTRNQREIGYYED